MREVVALVLGLFDLVRLVGDRRIGSEHLFEQARAHAQLVGHGAEIVVEPLFTRDESKSGHGFPPKGARIVPYALVFSAA